MSRGNIGLSNFFWGGQLPPLTPPPVEAYAYIVSNTSVRHNLSFPLSSLVVVRTAHAFTQTQVEYEYRVHTQTTPAGDFAEPGADFFAGPRKTVKHAVEALN